MPDNLHYSRRNRFHLATNDQRIVELATEMVAENRRNRKKEYSDQERAEYQRHFELTLIDLLAASETDELLPVFRTRG